MKHLLALVFALVAIPLLSYWFSPWLSRTYLAYFNLPPGPDGEAELVRFMLFGQWPAFFFLSLGLFYLCWPLCFSVRLSG